MLFKENIPTKSKVAFYNSNTPYQQSEQEAVAIPFEPAIKITQKYCENNKHILYAQSYYTIHYVVAIDNEHLLQQLLLSNGLLSNE